MEVNHSKIQKIYSYWMIAPAMILYTVLFIIPACSGLILSFLNTGTLRISSFSFAGLENYKTVIQNPYFNIAIKNTLIFAFITTLGKVVLGIALALLVNRKMMGINYIRTIFFLPAILNNVAVGLVFRSMMHPNGLINRSLASIGLGVLERNWLTDARIAIISCAIVEIWKWTGYTMVIFLAGLQSIDKTFYEAARLDGADSKAEFRYITVPLIMPAINNAMVISIVGGLKVFDIVQSLTKGGPGNATSVFGTLIYSSFSNGSYGRGCAASIILTSFVLLVALPTNSFLSRKEIEL